MLNQELEWRTRKERIDKKLSSLNPAWKIIHSSKVKDYSALTNHALEEYPTKNGPFKEEKPSRNKPASRGEKSLYDSEGGEWRIDKGTHGNPHWDYKPPVKNGEWINIDFFGNIIP